MAHLKLLQLGPHGVVRGGARQSPKISRVPASQDLNQAKTLAISDHLMQV